VFYTELSRSCRRLLTSVTLKHEATSVIVVMTLIINDNNNNDNNNNNNNNTTTDKRKRMWFNKLSTVTTVYK